MTFGSIVSRTVSLLLTFTLVAAAGVVVTAYVAMRLDEVRFATVLTGSMEPGIPTGSVVIGTPLAADQVQPGDVIMFRPPEPFATPGDAPVVHRVVHVGPAEDSGTMQVRTRGDANAMDDPWVLDARATTMFHVRADSAQLGLLSRFGSIASWPVAMAIPLLLATAWALKRIWAPSGRSRPRPRVAV
jgi:signal peptidase